VPDIFIGFAPFVDFID